MDIKEVIVVEGKSDTIAIQRATGADTIETNGSAVGQEALIKIRHAQQTRGVIVFTDPDYPGRRIRAIIEQQIPDVKHAFLTRDRAIAKNGKKVGIEHATDEDIRNALQAVYTVDTTTIEETPRDLLIEARLIGHPEAKKRRDRLSELLQIGQVNGKGLQKRLTMFRISEATLMQALLTIDEEEQEW
ncbi:ribonuclease M5 [Sporosarcina sp. BI001-red]|uniref:ribonuclease M5 n=1 Tax=Sporosarcina sp. BI001-red TaxID=2282866 RepID=UPI000E226B46|nr:ribonuclease M5 [Sporosarcina sp. BI001-red]REB11443.1 ribonuclease M5 [Sporosarcina sp. BI001-red]